MAYTLSCSSLAYRVKEDDKERYLENIEKVLKINLIVYMEKKRMSTIFLY